MIDELHGAIPEADIVSEAHFLEAWQRHASGREPLSMAIAGGLLAARFGWIFIAGYQAAIRRVFPDESFDGWVAFAVSEDKTGEQPGMRYQQTEGEGSSSDAFQLDGVKTWVAASAHCQTVIVSAKGAGGTQYFALDRHQAGVQITTRPSGRVLPDLSQGSLECVHALPARALPSNRVGEFQVTEVLYIYTAFLASTFRFFPDRRVQVEGLVQQVQDIVTNDPLDWDEAMLELDRGVQELVRDMRQREGEANTLWRRDYKLIAMYSRQA